MAGFNVLGQVVTSGTIGTPVDLYTAGTQTVTSTLVICNQTATAQTYRVQVRVAGAASAAKQYIVYDAVVNPNDTNFLTIGLTLAITDVVSVAASSALVSFGLYGQN